MSCSQCGVCCKLFAINLTKEEYFSGKFDTWFKDYDLGSDFTHVQECGGNIVSQKGDESCIYLKDALCSIHSIRPQVCRDFGCESGLKKYRQMIREIRKAKRVVK